MTNDISDYSLFTTNTKRLIREMERGILKGNTADALLTAYAVLAEVKLLTHAVSELHEAEMALKQ
jgi:hypothetical protein